MENLRFVFLSKSENISVFQYCNIYGDMSIDNKISFVFVCANHPRRKIITSCPSSTKLRRCPKFPSEAINWWAATRAGLGWTGLGWAGCRPSLRCQGYPVPGPRPGEGHTGCGGGRAAADHPPSQRHRTLLHSYCPLSTVECLLLQLDNDPTPEPAAASSWSPLTQPLHLARGSGTASPGAG